MLDGHLARLGMDLVFIDGNHDNHEALRALPKEPDRTSHVTPHIKYLPRGGRIKHGGQTIGGRGGAFSIDFKRRTEGVGWWPREEVEAHDVQALIADGPVDILLTRDVSSGFGGAKPGIVRRSQEIQDRAQVSCDLIHQAVNALTPTVVFRGHWRRRLTTDLYQYKQKLHPCRSFGPGLFGRR